MTPEVDRVSAVLERSRALGFLGPMPVPDQIRHSLGFANTVEGTPRRVLDLGSGGGIPGLVLAVMAWPASRFTLLDSRTRRTAFLAQVVAELGLEARVVVVQARAEDVGRDPAHRGAYDTVLARSFGAPGVTAECGAPLLEVGGVLVVSEPPTAHPERWPAVGLDEVGLVSEADRAGGADYARLRQVRPCPDRYPRRVGLPTKRPLF